MARKPKTMFTLTSADKRTLQTMAKTGLITNDLAINHFGIGKDRMTRFEKEGLVKACPAVVRGKSITVYKLTKEGKKYVKSNIPSVEYIYKGASISHDLALCLKYLQLSEHEQNICLCETAVFAEYGKYSYASAPDIIVPKYTITMETEVVHVPMRIIEIATKTYKQEDYEAKEIYAEKIIGVPKETIEYEQAKDLLKAHFN